MTMKIYSSANSVPYQTFSGTANTIFINNLEFDLLMDFTFSITTKGATNFNLDLYMNFLSEGYISKGALINDDRSYHVYHTDMSLINNTTKTETIKQIMVPKNYSLSLTSDFSEVGTGLGNRFSYYLIGQTIKE